MKKILECIVATLIVLMFIMSIVGIISLTFWGLGALIIWIFKIPYDWTFLHGLGCTIIFWLLRKIFEK